MEPSRSGADGASSWEEYRKRAKKLEGELDVKLAAFSKLCLKYDGGSEGVSALAAETIDSKGQELDRLLQELESVNGVMQSAMRETESHAHTLTRHRDILREYVQERERLRGTISRTRNRTEALDLKSETAPLMGVQVQGSAGTLLRERATLHSASVGIDEVIDQATAIADDIKNQGNLFGSMTRRLMEVSQKYPVLNGLLRSISRRKSRDAIILAAVVASCLAITIVYIVWK